MNPERDDERALEDYLRGDSGISRLYREGARERPPPELDSLVLSRARRGAAPASRARAGPHARRRAQRPAQRWALPLSLAAVVMLSVTLVLLVQDPELAPPSGEEPAARPAAAPEADAARSEAAPSAAAEEKARREGAASRMAPAPRSEDEAPALRKSPERLVAPPPADELESGARREARPLEEQRQSFDAGRAPPAAAQAPAAPALGDAPEAVRADPRAWLRFIEALAARGDEAGAARELEAFRSRYPAHPLPPSLRELSGSRAP